MKWIISKSWSESDKTCWRGYIEWVREDKQDDTSDTVADKPAKKKRKAK